MKQSGPVTSNASQQFNFAAKQRSETKTLLGYLLIFVTDIIDTFFIRVPLPHPHHNHLATATRTNQRVTITATRVTESVPYRLLHPLPTYLSLLHTAFPSAPMVPSLSAAFSGALGSLPPSAPSSISTQNFIRAKLGEAAAQISSVKKPPPLQATGLKSPGPKSPKSPTK